LEIFYSINDSYKKFIIITVKKYKFISFVYFLPYLSFYLFISNLF